MSVREAIERNSRIVMIAVAALILIVCVFGWRSLGGSSIGPTANTFFAADDGSEAFVDSMSRLPPFDHAGKQAYLAAVYSCDGGKTRFIGYLQRYTAAALTRIQARIADPKVGPSHALADLGPSDIEVKKPGPKNPWVSRADVDASNAVMKVACPNGGTAEAVQP